MVQVVLTDTKQVEEIRQREMDITKEKIHKILEAGAKVTYHEPTPFILPPLSFLLYTSYELNPS
jgi:hypothetical protein